MSKLLAFIDTLREGRSVEFPHSGGYLVPRIRNGETVKVVPTSLDKVQKDDIVLCRLDGRIALGVVGDFRSDRAKIIDMAGKKMGWATQAHIYGKAKYA